MGQRLPSRTRPGIRPGLSAGDTRRACRRVSRCQHLIEFAAPMKLRCYALKADPPTLRAAPTTRAWMDRVPDNHAYRCLPLDIANTHGWEILSPCAFSVEWNGSIHAHGITFTATDGFPHLAQYAASHFAYGIVTFHLWYLFRTEPGWDLFASGSL